MPPRQDDACQCCGALYPNGLLPILSAQVLLLLGLLMGTGSLLDCEFVKVQTADLFAVDPFLFAQQLGNATTSTTTTGLGFFTFLDAKGNCVLLREDKHEYEFEDYSVFLGSDWCSGRSLGTVATVAAFLLWGWILALSCGAHKRALRWLLAFLVGVVVVVMFAVTFKALNSDLCRDELERGCSFGRAAGLGIFSVFCFFATGVALLFSKDYRRDFKSPQPLSRFHDSPRSSDTGESQNDDASQQEVWDGLGDAQEVPVDRQFARATLGDLMAPSASCSTADNAR